MYISDMQYFCKKSLSEIKNLTIDELKDYMEEKILKITSMQNRIAFVRIGKYEDLKNFCYVLKIAFQDKNSGEISENILKVPVNLVKANGSYFEQHCLIENQIKYLKESKFIRL